MIWLRRISDAVKREVHLKLVGLCRIVQKADFRRYKFSNQGIYYKYNAKYFIPQLIFEGSPALSFLTRTSLLSILANMFSYHFLIYMLITSTLGAIISTEKSSSVVNSGVEGVETVEEPPVKIKDVPAAKVEGELPLRYIGESVPANCTAFYSCCTLFDDGSDDCLKWCVKKVRCNKRLVVVKVPSFVEIVDDESILPIASTETSISPESLPKVPANDTMQSEKTIKGVQVIDIPCLSGSLPDRRGRCREVW